MNSGSINSNECGGPGGGIFVWASTLNLNNGSIYSNKSLTGNGGGIEASGGSTFNMKGGSVYSNSCAKGGPGLFMLDGSLGKNTFRMYGGSITGLGISPNNVYEYYGGTVN